MPDSLCCLWNKLHAGYFETIRCNPFKNLSQMINWFIKKCNDVEYNEIHWGGMRCNEMPWKCLWKQGDGLNQEQLNAMRGHWTHWDASWMPSDEVWCNEIPVGCHQTKFDAMRCHGSANGSKDTEWIRNNWMSWDSIGCNDIQIDTMRLHWMQWDVKRIWNTVGWN